MIRRLLCFLFLIGISTTPLVAQNKTEPWTKSELMAPKVLAQKIRTDQTQDMLILSIGPGDLIKGSVEIGPAEYEKNIEEMKNYLKGVNKNKTVVIYCGCCPFKHCPNVRPAFRTLEKMGFTHARLLNLSNNIKTDWLDKGYPTKKSPR